MKNFNSFLAPWFNEFLIYRENTGYTTRNTTSDLRLIDRYLMDKGADWGSLTSSFFLQMRSELPNEPVTVNRVFTGLRVFFRFLIRQGYVEQSPVQDIPRLRENFVVPFIFSRKQTNRFIKAAGKRVRRKEKYFLTDLAIYLALLLMARCGLRISEPLKLLRHHYRKDDRTIYIEKTKFNKHRLIPAPKAVCKEIDNYLSVRQAMKPDDQNPYLLAGKDQGPLKDYQVRSLFHKAVRAIGLEQKRRVVNNMNFSKPVPHCLRHAFAINTLRNIMERKESAQNALPVLAAYLGHKKYHYTSVYLKVADAKNRNDLLDFTIWQEWKNI
jgi:site-specific recombinase XerD